MRKEPNTQHEDMIEMETKIDGLKKEFKTLCDQELKLMTGLSAPHSSVFEFKEKIIGRFYSKKRLDKKFESLFELNEYYAFN